MQELLKVKQTRNCTCNDFDSVTTSPSGQLHDIAKWTSKSTILEIEIEFSSANAICVDGFTRILVEQESIATCLRKRVSFRGSQKRLWSRRKRVTHSFEIEIPLMKSTLIYRRFNRVSLQYCNTLWWWWAPFMAFPSFYKKSLSISFKVLLMNLCEFSTEARRRVTQVDIFISGLLQCQTREFQRAID